MVVITCSKIDGSDDLGKTTRARSVEDKQTDCLQRLSVVCGGEGLPKIKVYIADVCD